MLELQVVEARNRVLGEDHPDSLTSMANLASIYADQDRLKEAEGLEVQVMEKTRGLFGDEHPHSLTLGAILWNQGRLNEAEVGNASGGVEKENTW